MNKLFDSIYTSTYIQALKKPLANATILFDLMCYENSDDFDFTVLVNEICINNPQMTFFASVSDNDSTAFIKTFNRASSNINIKVVKKNSLKYFKLYAQAEYIYSNVLPPDVFSKRKGQRYLIDSRSLYNESDYDEGNYDEGNYDEHADKMHFSKFFCSSAIQKAMLKADVIMCSSKKEMESLRDFYFLDKLYYGKFIIIENYTNEKLFQCIHAEFFKAIPYKQGKFKDNILIFCSDLRRNGMTTSLLNLLSLIDLDKNNYIMTYPEEMFLSYPERLSVLPDKSLLLPVHGGIVKKTPWEVLLHSLYFRFNIDSPFVYRKVAGIYQRAYEHFFGDIDIKTVIHFTGYSAEFALLFMNSPAKRIIFAHNDMYEEYVEKKNFHMASLLHAYERYEVTACVSDAVKESLNKLKLTSVNAIVLENAHDHNGIIHNVNKSPAMDADTYMSVSMIELMRIINSDVKKFVTIGRFSKEKGHIKLMKAFSVFCENERDAVLIIIGGYGPLLQDTISFKDSLSCRDRIIIIKSIINPSAIMKYCDLFILPSDREPLGLVLLEAASLNMPIIATDIRGSGDFMRKYGGYLVENSVNGLLEGMKAYMAKDVCSLSIDFDEYNKRIVSEFYEMIGYSVLSG